MVFEFKTSRSKFYEDRMDLHHLKLEYLQNDSMPEGSWAKFVKSMFQSVFPTGQLGVKQKWNEEQDRIRTRVQHLMSGNLEIK